AHREMYRPVHQRPGELANKPECLGAISREAPHRNVAALALANLDIPIALKAAAEDALPLVLVVKHPPDLIKDKRWLLAFDAAIDGGPAHAVRLLAATAEPIE